MDLPYRPYGVGSARHSRQGYPFSLFEPAAVGFTALREAIDDGHEHIFGSGANARMFTISALATKASVRDEIEEYRSRVAFALEIDRICKILHFNSHLAGLGTAIKHVAGAVAWAAFDQETPQSTRQRPLPKAPFRVLDAPSLRDDYYCSVLAYSATAQTLAVGLGNVLYTWSEDLDVRTERHTEQKYMDHVDRIFLNAGKHEHLSNWQVRWLAHSDVYG